MLVLVLVFHRLKNKYIIFRVAALDMRKNVCLI